MTLVVTLGTGIGSALFLDGRLLPNTEFGHLSINGIDCCPWASAAARVREELSWAQWISRLQDYLSYAEFLIWPDLIIIGGGISHDAEQFLPLLQLDATVVRAELGNDAGIIGAAFEASALYVTRTIVSSAPRTPGKPPIAGSTWLTVQIYDPGADHPFGGPQRSEQAHVATGAACVSAPRGATHGGDGIPGSAPPTSDPTLVGCRPARVPHVTGSGPDDEPAVDPAAPCP